MLKLAMSQLQLFYEKFGQIFYPYTTKKQNWRFFKVKLAIDAICPSGGWIIVVEKYLITVRLPLA